jgi:hypothetical protein
MIPHEPWPLLSCLPSAPRRAWSATTNPLTRVRPAQLLRSPQLSACWPRPHTDGKEVTSSHFFPSFDAFHSPFFAAPAHSLHENAKSSPLFSTVCELFCNYGGGGGCPWRCHPDRREGSAFLYFVPSLLRYFLFSISFRIRTWRQTPRFAVFWPHSSALNPFRIRTSRKSVCKVFRIRTCKKQGEGDGICAISYYPS